MNRRMNRRGFGRASRYPNQCKQIAEVKLDHGAIGASCLKATSTRRFAMDAQGNVVDMFDLLWNRHNKVDILPPRGSVRYPILQAMGSPDSALCVVEWSDSANRRRETRATVRT